MINQQEKCYFGRATNEKKINRMSTSVLMNLKNVNFEQNYPQIKPNLLSQTEFLKNAMNNPSELIKINPI